MTQEFDSLFTRIKENFVLLVRNTNSGGSGCPVRKPRRAVRTVVSPVLQAALIDVGEVVDGRAELVAFQHKDIPIVVVAHLFVGLSWSLLILLD